MPSPTDEPEHEHKALRLFRERLADIARQHPELVTPEQQDRLADYLTAQVEDEDDGDEK
jgi:hypothetical protein